MTCMLQPLDIGVNKPMKQMLQLKWNEWYCSGPQSYTAGGDEESRNWRISASG
ncbi:hypothetical protein DPMN_019479 [Dreissena polymorpha]|uniref:Uncharacterized protein n=1 Tax=Dreissena polymorpha TaxID=45954 RepID=A0A9D4NL70_DREPO|nr:hypothetical protein DPMN_019479 [Dreissena polymorpha]